MGRIKTMLIKRTVSKLVKNYGNGKFSDNFENNKTAVTELVDVRSKKLRNIIAGSMTKQLKIKKK